MLYKIKRDKWFDGRLTAGSVSLTDFLENPDLGSDTVMETLSGIRVRITEWGSSSES
jgi:hypothetical protein